MRLLPRHARGSASGASPRLAVHWPATRCGCRSPTRRFDAVTISFGLRNVADTDAALAEMPRVTRPGGRLVVCEFSHPTWAPFRTVYIEYLMRALPAVARAGRRATRTPTSTSPSRSGPGPTRPALAGRIGGRGLVRRRLAQPHRRHRRAAPRARRALRRFRRRQSAARGLIGKRPLTSHENGRLHMGTDDKTNNKVEEIAGEAKEAVGERDRRRRARAARASATRPRPTSSRPARRSRTPSRTERPADAPDAEGPVRWTGPSAGPGPACVD